MRSDKLPPRQLIILRQITLGIDTRNDSLLCVLGVIDGSSEWRMEVQPVLGPQGYNSTTEGAQFKTNVLEGGFL